MSKTPQSEKVQPCLLDRLVDDNPETIVETGRGISISRYRQAVLRDLEWLLNSKSRIPSEGLDRFPETEKSVLNFGMPDLAGRVVDRESIAQIEKNIVETLLRFEPRLIPDSLHVRRIENVSQKSAAQPNIVSFEISGELWASPMHEPFHLKTEIDLDTGKCRI
jgi:type VI secretion system protein ImpF